MKLATICLLLILGFLEFPASAAPVPAGVKLIKEVRLRGDVKASQYELANGLTVVLVPNRRAPLTSVYHWVKAGSLQETPGITGIAHLFEHMMFRPLAPDEPTFFMKIKKLGVSANAFTEFAMTVFTSTVPNKNLHALLEMEAARFQRLKVTPALLDVERKAVWSEYSTKMDSSPRSDLWEQIYRIAYPKHPYGWTVIGFREDLNKIQAEDCNRFFARFYRPNNTGLFIAGDIDLKQTLGWIVKNYAGWERGLDSKMPPVYTEPPKYVEADGKVRSPARQFLMGFRIPDIKAEITPVADLAQHIFFESDYSLARRRLQHKLKYTSIISAFNSSSDNGLIKIYAVPTAGHAQDDIRDEVLKLGEDFASLSDAEYTAYLRQYQVGSAESVLRNETLNSEIARSWGRYGDISYLAAELEKPPAVTRSEITEFAKKYFIKDNMVIAVTPGLE